MDYESRSHTSRPVANAAEAVRLIHARTIADYECPCWPNAKGQRIALVDDAHINCS